jgi:outer membrane immunogenic protein
MKKYALAALCMTALMAAPAIAADLGAPAYKAAPPAMTTYNWNGVYIGGNGGIGWGRKCWNFLGAAAAPVSLDEGCFDVTGGLAGGQIGVNFQTGRFLVGVEFQGDWARIDGNAQSNVAGFAAFNNRSQIDGFGTFTGRLGYVLDTNLIYVKGGGVWAHEKHTVRTASADVLSASESRFGWTVGGGFEFGFGPNWSLAFEYDYLGLGTKTLSFAPVAAGFAGSNESIRQDIHTATVRLNYRIGGWGPSVVTARY